MNVHLCLKSEKKKLNYESFVQTHTYSSRFFQCANGHWGIGQKQASESRQKVGRRLATRSGRKGNYQAAFQALL